MMVAIDAARLRGKVLAPTSDPGEESSVPSVDESE